jgi:hypothetical protein
MPHYITCFEAGVFYGMLKSEWNKLKDDEFFNKAEEEIIDSNMIKLIHQIYATCFKSKNNVRALQKRMLEIDEYIEKNKKKPRLFKDLTQLQNLAQ